MNMELGLRRNLTILKSLKGFQYLLFLLPVLVPFYQSQGLSVGEVIYLQAVFGVSVFLFEVPTGYISDKWSRKLSIQIGFLLCGIAYCLYGLLDGFLYYAFLQMVIGFGSCCISGSNDALMYDSLLSMGESHNYVKHKSSMSSVGNFMEAFAGIIGGLVAVIGLVYASYLQGLAMLIGFVVGLWLVEPPIHRDEEVVHLDELKKAMKIVFVEKREIFWVLMYGAAISGMTFSSVWLFQPVLIENGVSVGLFGWFWAAMNLSVGLGVLTVPWMQKRFSLKFSLLIIPVLACVSLAVIGLWGALVSLVFYLGVTWARAARGVFASVLLNERVPSSLRATILSMDSMFFRLVFAIVAPVLGWIVDGNGVGSGFILVSIVFGVLSVIPYRKLIKYRVI